MKTTYNFLKLCFSTRVLSLFLVFLSSYTFCPDAHSKVPIRRPTSPASPMWQIHIDTWNYPDPQKIIDLIPKDIRPYVVFNLSFSVSHNTTTGKWLQVDSAYETAKSWLRTCAQNQVWAMIQQSSGGFAHFSDFDLSVYEEFYRDYPNFIGFNYAEQFWGFGDTWSVTWAQRMAHFTDLMKLNQKYGGYLCVSWCGAGSDINPVAMMKRNPDFAAICKETPEHFILCEKFTSTDAFSDIESVCEGAYLSGFSGQYGIRFDQCGWVPDSAATDLTYPVAAGAAPILEHIMLTGETVIDGPELIWAQDFKELSTATTSDGYTMRRWGTYPQFENISIDIFRKILDSTVRILSRKEVIDRTKVVIVNDVTSGTAQEIYSSPLTMFEGLYRMDDDGNFSLNTSWFKKTGRYPAIPTVYELGDSLANTFQTPVDKSTYSTRWPSIADKVTEFNTLFSEEYTGDLYAGRSENGWVTYNPFKTGKTANASIPLKYNTCDSIHLTYCQYTTGIIKEYSDKLTFYLTNYDNYYTSLKTDTIKIYGSTLEPTYSYEDRADHEASTVTSNWSDGVFTLYVNHNGPLDLIVDCSGTATDRLTTYTTASLVVPNAPSVYTGPRQYEAECFDRKSVSSVVTSGYSGTIRNYTGQGYLKFGTSSSAVARDTVNALRKGKYKILTKYLTSSGTVTTVDLYVNGVKVATPEFTKTVNDSTWSVDTTSATLNAGDNIIMYKANNTGTYSLSIDNIIITQGADNGVYNFTSDVASTVATSPAADMITVQSGSAGVVSYTDANGSTSNCFKSYSAGSTNGTGVADLTMFPTDATNYSVVWKEWFGSTGSSSGVLLRGSSSEMCTYADSLKQGYLFMAQYNADNTITLKPSIAGGTGLTDKTSYTTSFTLQPNQPCWFHASAYGDTLVFECSTDSVNWVGATTATFIDSTYLEGATQLVWGMDANNFSWVMDNIAYSTSILSVSKYSMADFSAVENSDPSTSQTFNVYGQSLAGNIEIAAPNGYELSLAESSGYASSLSLSPTNGLISTTAIYVRLKSGLNVASYTGDITASTKGLPSQTISLSGTVTPQPVSRIYDFSDDVAKTAASTPPALNTTIGTNNGATAGVVSFTDTEDVTSNMLRAYSGGARNSTGVVNLDLFSKTSTDYSVTWKQCVGSTSIDYKVGVLLRGDTTAVGTSSTGYVQGLMNGYLFIVYTASTLSQSQFRIYKSTSSTSLSVLSNTTVSTLLPSVNQPIWYRATVSGSSTISLKLEYSTDSITWNSGTSTSDGLSPMFTSGATQIVWGLGAASFSFYLDNITFYGVESESSDSTTAGIEESNIDTPTVISREYYTITGIKVGNRLNNMKGLFIMKCLMSDGTTTASKIFLK
jgi:hypothetical protein